MRPPSGSSRPGASGIPQVVSLGALDVIVISSTGLPDPLPERFAGRPVYRHDDVLAATRATPDECRELAAVVAHKLNAATGPWCCSCRCGASPCSPWRASSSTTPTADAALVSTAARLIDPQRVELHDVEHRHQRSRPSLWVWPSVCTSSSPGDSADGAADVADRARRERRGGRGAPAPATTSGCSRSPAPAGSARRALRRFAAAVARAVRGRRRPRPPPVGS